VIIPTVVDQQILDWLVAKIIETVHPRPRGIISVWIRAKLAIETGKLVVKLRRLQDGFVPPGGRVLGSRYTGYFWLLRAHAHPGVRPGGTFERLPNARRRVLRKRNSTSRRHHRNRSCLAPRRPNFSAWRVVWGFPERGRPGVTSAGITRTGVL